MTWRWVRRHRDGRGRLTLATIHDGLTGHPDARLSHKEHTMNHRLVILGPKPRTAQESAPAAPETPRPPTHHDRATEAARVLGYATLDAYLAAHEPLTHSEVARRLGGVDRRAVSEWYRRLGLVKPRAPLRTVAEDAARAAGHATLDDYLIATAPALSVAQQAAALSVPAANVERWRTPLIRAGRITTRDRGRQARRAPRERGTVRQQAEAVAAQIRYELSDDHPDEFEVEQMRMKLLRLLWRARLRGEVTA